MTTTELVPVDRVLNDGPPTGCEPAPAGAEVQDQAVQPIAESEQPGWTQPLLDVDDRLAEVDVRLAALSATVTAQATELTSTRATADGARTAADAAQQAAGTAQAAADNAKAAADAAGAGIEAGTATAARTDAAVAELEQRLAAAEARIASINHEVQDLAGLGSAVTELADRAAGHDAALADVGRSIAAEVERYAGDDLVESRHSLQLAVNSLAQLALAMGESARDLTDDVSAESATVLLDSFRVDLDAILLQLGFEALGVAAGAVFDPHLHRALKRVATTDPLQDKRITRVIRDGYRNTATGRILLFADVEVGRHRS